MSVRLRKYDMKKTEILLTGLVLLATGLRMASFPAGELISAVAFIALALFYLVFSSTRFGAMISMIVPEGATAANKREYAFRKFLSVAAGVVFCFALLGILFVLNYWKLASFFWCLGMFFTVPVGALSLGKYMLQPAPFYKAIALRAGLLLLAGISLVAAEM